MADKLFMVGILYIVLLPFLRISLKAFFIAWTIPCILTIIYAVFTGGHPPGVTVVPIILFVWFIGLIPMPFLNLLKNRNVKSSPANEDNDETSKSA